jgi:hypothetical protein
MLWAFSILINDAFQNLPSDIDVETTGRQQVSRTARMPFAGRQNLLAHVRGIRSKGNNDSLQRHF